MKHDRDVKVPQICRGDSKSLVIIYEKIERNTASQYQASIIYNNKSLVAKHHYIINESQMKWYCIYPQS